MIASYTVVLLASEPRRALALKRALRAAFDELGLSDWLSFRTEGTYDPTEPNHARAAIYLGAGQRDEKTTALAAKFVRSGWFILPVLPTTSDYPSRVPRALLGVNGVEWKLDHPVPSRVVNLVLSGLGLLRRDRRVFISYRRSASGGVARQLAQGLFERGYQPFLDTWSIDGGRMFQPALWDRMANTDQVLFLDTADALQSRWVAEEFARAAELSISTLHLVWPGRDHTREAALSEVSYLDEADFLGRPPDTGGRGRLRAKALSRTIDLVELLRVRAWHLRRAAIVSSFVRRLRDRGQCVVRPSGALHLSSCARGDAVIVPVIGIPTSDDFEEAQRQSASGEEACVLYQRRGISTWRRAHLAWLATHLPVTELATEEVSAWLSRC